MPFCFCWSCTSHVLNRCASSLAVLHCSAPVIGFKAAPSGDVATNAWSKKDITKTKTVASGQYTFYQDPNALEIGRYLDSQGNQWGGQKAPAGAGSYSKWQDCLSACDDDVL